MSAPEYRLVKCILCIVVSCIHANIATELHTIKLWMPLRQGGEATWRNQTAVCMWEKYKESATNRHRPGDNYTYPKKKSQ